MTVIANYYLDKFVLAIPLFNFFIVKVKEYTMSWKPPHKIANQLTYITVEHLLCMYKLSLLLKLISTDLNY